MVVETSFVTLHQLAAVVGLPPAWLRAEAVAGRIPHLRAGRSLKFNVEAVERALIGRAEVGSSRVDLQACKLEYSIVSPK